jgi:hypothetical protein
MALWSWRTLPDERVEVDRGQGFEVAQPIETPSVVQTADRVLEWLPLAETYAEKYGVPVSWILAIIFAESGGNPKAENFCCAGLMAIFWTVHGKSKADMLDPEKNVDYGTSLLAQSRARGQDLPGAASVHVAGGGTTGTPRKNSLSPWGMAEHMWPEGQGDGSVGYIDRVVRANNMFVERLEHGDVPPPLPYLGQRASALAQLTFFGLGAAVGYAAISLLPRVR